jgi:hypothetical protein
MSHFAEISNDNKVIRVLVGNNNDSDEGYSWLVDNLGGNWIKTSYNTRGGVHYGSDGNPDGREALNYNFAGIGYSWDGKGFYAPQPYPSFTLNSNSYLWEPPIACPTDGKLYTWDEPTLSWQVAPDAPTA